MLICRFYNSNIIDNLNSFVIIFIFIKLVSFDVHDVYERTKYKIIYYIIPTNEQIVLYGLKII